MSKSKKEINNTPSTLLAFDSSYILTAIFKSISEAAAMTGCIRQSLIKAAYGDIISVGRKYWRVLPPDFQIDPDDVGKLTLFEFDESVGQDRKIYATKKMLRTSSMLESEYMMINANRHTQNPQAR